MKTASAPRPLKIAHRGAAGHAPENTLGAVETGIRLGADYVEIDVQRTRDGRLVVIHDSDVARTTNGRGKVGEMTFEELRRLDAGSGEMIPALEEVLEVARDRTGLMIEIKVPGIAAQLYHTVDGHFPADKVIYASFHHAELLEVRDLAAAVDTLALIDGVPVLGARFALDARATHAGIALDSLTPAFVKALQESGLQVFVYTVNKPEDIRWLESLPVDGIISDHPDRL